MKIFKPIEYNDTIENIDHLIMQLESLKDEAQLMFTQDSIFRADYKALKMVINFLYDNKEVLECN